MKTKVLFGLFAALSMLTIVACENESENNASYYTANATCDSTSLAATYTNSIGDILDGSCSYNGCHSTTTAKEGVILDNYADAKDEFTNGESLCTINHDCTPMPEGSAKLDDATIALLTCWVKNGCPE